MNLYLGDSVMKLLDQFVLACRMMNFAAATENFYRHWIEEYLRYRRRVAG
jgi:hypothetical protein